jgi:hypothetical protein
VSHTASVCGAPISRALTHSVWRRPAAAQGGRLRCAPCSASPAWTASGPPCWAGCRLRLEAAAAAGVLRRQWQPSVRIELRHRPPTSSSSSAAAAKLRRVVERLDGRGVALRLVRLVRLWSKAAANACGGVAATLETAAGQRWGDAD